MNNKITMPALVAMLALKSGLTKEKSEEFLREFFKLISDTLLDGETVKIKALGTFKTISVETRRSVNVTNGEEIVIPGHNRIVFVPSRDIADEINAPFSMFESVELNPEAEEELLTPSQTDEMRVEPGKTVSQPEEIRAENKEEEVPEPEISVEKETVEVEETEPEIEPEATTETEPEKEPEATTETEPEIEPEATTETEPEIEQETEPLFTPEKKKRKGMRFIGGFVCGLVLAMLLSLLGYFIFLRKPVEKVEAEKAEVQTMEVVSVAATDSIEPEGESKEEHGEGEISGVTDETENDESPVAETEPSDKVVKDVIGPKNYLTTMAQRHYGNFNLWAYIYEENKSFLGHPDRIKPGTEVVIPPLSKYGIDPNNPEDVKKAKRLGVEIYKRYNK